MRFILTTTTLLASMICLIPNARGADLPTELSYSGLKPRQSLPASWKWSLAPVLASEALDVSSSYGMRELNPVLSGSDGRFGMQSTAIKLGVTGALLGAEYLIVKAHPGSARVFTKLNWAAAVVTFGVVAHNYAIR
jgi:hypothetical protein